MWLLLLYHEVSCDKLLIETCSQTKLMGCCTSLHLAHKAQEKYEKCWHKSQLLVLTQCLHLKLPPTVHPRGYFDLVSCDTRLEAVNTPRTTVHKWWALWLPPTELHAEAESEDHAQNIGHVFVRGPQEPIPNSWHITAQSYSKDESADLCLSDHALHRAPSCSDVL